MDTSSYEGAPERLLGGVLRSGLSRRGLLRAGVVAAGATTLAPLLAACGSSDDKATATKPAATSAAASPSVGASVAASPTTGRSGAASPTVGSASPTTGGAAPTATTAALPPTPTKGAVLAGKGGKIVAVRQNDSDSLDPQRTILGDSYNVFRNIFDPLVTIAPSLEFEPVIAEKYAISDDGLTYAFTIRKGMQFHDGSDVTAADVKYTFDRATNPDAPSQAVSFIDAFDRADLVDAENVNLVLKTANAPFLSNIAVEYFGILPQAATDAAGDDFGTNPVGSGPWKFKEWIQGEQATLEANSDYTQVRSFVNSKGGPAADELIFRAIPENQTQIAAFQTGEVNVMILLPNTEYKNFKDDPNYQVFVDPGSTEISAIEFATLPPAGEPGDAVYKPPFDDLKLRQAVAYGINADEIIDKIYFGLAQRAYGPMPTGLFAFDPEIEQFGYHFDADKANSLLDEAGWSMGADGVRAKDGNKLELAFWHWTDDTIGKAVQVIQNQLGQIGIKLNLTVLDIGTMVAQLPAGDNNLNFTDVGWPEADILYVLTSFGWGVGRYQPKDYMDLLKQARETSDQAKRKEFYTQAQKLFLEDLPWVPLWSPVAAHAVRKEVKNFAVGAYGAFIWEDVFIES